MGDRPNPKVKQAPRGLSLNAGSYPHPGAKVNRLGPDELGPPASAILDNPRTLAYRPPRAIPTG